MLVLALTAAIVIVDQWSKLLVRQKFFLGESASIIPGYFNFTYLRNTGAVWGIFQHQNEWLVLLSLVVLVLMAVFYRWLVNEGGGQQVAIGCLTGGIVGNLIDRLKYGWVTDFLDFHIAAFHWPAFNLADAAICTGVGIYVIATLSRATRDRYSARRGWPASKTQLGDEAHAVPPATL
ncbi:MAG: signal peptidase II [Lentisphaerae bacterium]|nr:signal peptidase II [Lentisphaerota bacterium]